MNNQTAVVLGATGLIGKKVVEELLAKKEFSLIRLLVRKPVEIDTSKAEVVITDFNNIQNFKINIGKGDCIFCCIGTTLKTVKGNKAAYRKVDYDIIVSAATMAAAAGFKQLLLVSSVGANSKSNNFYLKLKGEIERDISQLSFEGIHIFRPSILLGKRKQFRLMEKIGQEFMNIFSFVFIGALSKYKGVYARDVAKGMVEVAGLQLKGIHIYEYDQLKEVLENV